jgi:hypothetical protein
MIYRTTHSTSAFRPIPQAIFPRIRQARILPYNGLALLKFSAACSARTLHFFTYGQRLAPVNRIVQTLHTRRVFSRSPSHCTSRQKTRVPRPVSKKAAPRIKKKRRVLHIKKKVCIPFPAAK